MSYESRLLAGILCATDSLPLPPNSCAGERDRCPQPARAPLAATSTIPIVFTSGSERPTPVRADVSGSALLCPEVRKVRFISNRGLPWCRGRSIAMISAAVTTGAQRSASLRIVARISAGVFPTGSSNSSANRARRVRHPQDLRDRIGKPLGNCVRCARGATIPLHAADQGVKRGAGGATQQLRWCVSRSKVRVPATGPWSISHHAGHEASIC
jgi:hypothetical protein